MSFMQKLMSGSRSLYASSGAMPASDSVSTRIFMISDTHEGRDTAQESSTGPFRQPWPRCDVLLHSGDLTMTGQLFEYEETMQLLESIDAELKLVIAGNHDLSLHEEYYLTSERAQSHGQRWSSGGTWDPSIPRRAREFWTGERAKRARVHYLEEGLHDFTLSNGAAFTIYTSQWQPEFHDWAFNYPHEEDRWNPPHLVSGPNAKPAPSERDPHPIAEGSNVDIMMTHGPAHKHLDYCNNGTEAGCPHLLRALNRVRPRIHCCGHIHEAWGAELVEWEAKGPGSLGEKTTCLAAVNASLNKKAIAKKKYASPTDIEVISNRAVFLDMTKPGTRPVRPALRPGKETLLINSSVVDLEYAPRNAGFLVVIDLPKAEQ